MKFGKRIKSSLLAALLSLGLIFSWPMQAFAQEGADQDEEYESDELRGKIDAIDLAKRTIVIDDWVYNLSLTVKVHEGDKLSTDFALREKAQVVFEIDPDTRNLAVQTITDVWLNR